MNAPHVIPYQGSKRKLTVQILGQVKFGPVQQLYEPFAGSAAVTLAAAMRDLADGYVISDKYDPLCNLWKMIIETPEVLIEEYTALWMKGKHAADNRYFYNVRDHFNETKSPSALLYLIARCVKNAVRFNAEGNFNQSPDKRRLGMSPNKLAVEVRKTSQLLRGKTTIVAGDFRVVLANTTPDDLVYMDPPWQGTSHTRDPRYAFLLDLDQLIAELEILNSRRIPYLLSFDGTCGDRTYGKELPKHLRLSRVPIEAGRSSQATLLGRNERTVESLYLSPALVDRNKTSQSVKRHAYESQMALAI